MTVLNGSFSTVVSSFVKTFLAAKPEVIAVHLLSSLAVVVFVIYFFWKPTNAFISKQKEKLDNAHIRLAEATKEARTALNKLQQQQEELISEKDKFLLERKEKEKLIIKQKLEEAEKMKQAIVSEAAKKAKSMEEELKKTINEKIINLSVGLTEKLIQSSLNDKIQNKVIDSYLQEIDTVFQEETVNLQLDK